MITYKSLQNRDLCLRELRDTLQRLPSLKWKRNAVTRYERVFEGEVALVKMLQDTAAFIQCVYSSHIADTSSKLGLIAAKLIKSINSLLVELERCRSTNSSVRTNMIRPVTSSVTEIYRYSRRLPRHQGDCSHHWVRIGLASSVAYL